jgi:uncharacterized membrane protein (Fun14 family)
MPRWQQTVMTLAVAMASVGTVGQASKLLGDRYVSDATTQASAPDNATVVSSEATKDAQPPPREETFLQRNSGSMAKAGFGCIGGFILGWLARLFFKTIALITTLGVALLVGLSYFKIDTSGAEKKYKSAMEWVSSQGDRFYELGKQHLPGSTSLLGMFMGFRRKRVK